MGCGQSKIHLYPRKSKSKVNGKKSGHADGDTNADEEDGKVADGEDNGIEVNKKHDNEFQLEDNKINDVDCELSGSIIRAKNLSLLQNQEISTSQQNFFEMLDKKIEEGPDYDSNSETEIALEEARLNALVQHWETASLTASLCSSASRSLQSTPVHQNSLPKLIQTQPVSLQCVTPNTMPKETIGGISFLTHKPSYKLPHLMEHHDASSEHQQQQLMISHIMQQMATVPQQTQISAMAQRLKPVSSGGVSTTASSQPISMLANSSGSVATQPVECRILATSLPRVQQIAVSSQMASLNHYTSLSLSSVSTPLPPSQGFLSGIRSPRPDIDMISSTQLNLPNQMVYFNQPITHHVTPQLTTLQQRYQSATCFADPVPHNLQIDQSTSSSEYRFPAAISVQRLAPQVQRQLRETQELMKDPCPQLATSYGSPGPPVRSQSRTPARRPTLESKFSQEFS